MKIVQQIKAFLNIVYFLIRQFGLRPTNLKNIEDYRLEELIFKDIKAYPNSGFGEIHQRIGFEINKHKVRRILKQMVENGQLRSEGIKKGTRYSIEQNLQENH